MRFEELYNVLNEQDTKQSLQEKIKKQGWNYLNSGSFGTVYSKPNKNFVLKIYDDSSYDEYLNFIKQHSDNPHVVKTSKVFDYGNGLKMVAIEKLIPLKSSRWRERISEKYAMFLDTGKSDKNDFYKTLEKFEEYFAEQIETDIKYFQRANLKDRLLDAKKSKRRLRFFIENHLSLFRIIYQLDQFRDTSTTLDLHFGNFMIRPSTGEIVVTDPLC